jgi:hypothetical protein
VWARGEPEALLGALDDGHRAPVVAACEWVLGRWAERLVAGDPLVEAIAGDCGQCLVVDAPCPGVAGSVAEQRARPAGRLGDRRFVQVVADRVAVVAGGGDRLVQPGALGEHLVERTDLAFKPCAQGAQSGQLPVGAGDPPFESLALDGAGVAPDPAWRGQPGEAFGELVVLGGQCAFAPRRRPQPLELGRFQ